MDINSGGFLTRDELESVLGMLLASQPHTMCPSMPMPPSSRIGSLFETMDIRGAHVGGGAGAESAAPPGQKVSFEEFEAFLHRATSSRLTAGAVRSVAPLPVPYLLLLQLPAPVAVAVPVAVVVAVAVTRLTAQKVKVTARASWTGVGYGCGRAETAEEHEVSPRRQRSCHVSSALGPRSPHSTPRRKAVVVLQPCSYSPILLLPYCKCKCTVVCGALRRGGTPQGRGGTGGRRTKTTTDCRPTRALMNA